jgi:hypothetical protein
MRTRIDSELLHPLAQHILVHVQIAGSLRNCDTALAHQPHRLKLELAAELPSLHRRPPIGENSPSQCPPNQQKANQPPGKPAQFKPRGVPRVDDCRVLNGLFWVLRAGAPWRDLPECYGPRTTCYNRFNRWRQAGGVAAAATGA